MLLWADLFIHHISIGLYAITVWSYIVVIVGKALHDNPQQNALLEVAKVSPSVFLNVHLDVANGY